MPRSRPGALRRGKTPPRAGVFPATESRRQRKAAITKARQTKAVADNRRPPPATETRRPLTPPWRPALMGAPQISDKKHVTAAAAAGARIMCIRFTSNGRFPPPPPTRGSGPLLAAVAAVCVERAGGEEGGVGYCSRLWSKNVVIRVG